MNNILKRVMVASIAAVFIFSALGFAVDIDDAYADTSITVTDSTGKTFILDAPANKVATLGYGFTRTVVDLGAEDKIVAYDSSSSDLAKELEIEGVNVGSAFSGNKDEILKFMVQLRKSDKFDSASDVIILNNYSTTISEGSTRDLLEDAGFIVLCFGADTYDEVVHVVENIALVIGKESSEAMSKMYEAQDIAEDRAADIEDKNKVRAMYVSEQSGKLRVYNKGIAVSMIEMAGGKNVGADPDSSATYRDAEASLILQLNPDVVFLDGNHPMSEKEFQKNVLRTASIVVIKMGKDWNNYCPSVAEGLMVFSDAMIEEYDHSESVMDILYINSEKISSSGVILIVTLLGLLLMRRS